MLGPAQKAELIAAIYECFGVPAAAKHCSLSVKAVLEAADEDQDFAADIERAIQHLAPMAEQEMFRRAVRGVDSYVTSQGRVVFVTDKETGLAKPLVETKYSDSLLTKFLEARDRKTYGPKVEVSHKHEGYIAVPIMSAEQLQQMLTAPEDDAVFVDAEFREVPDLEPLLVTDADADRDTVPLDEAEDFDFEAAAEDFDFAA